MKCIPFILMLVIACSGLDKNRNLQVHDHAEDSLFAQEVNSALLKDFGGEFHSIEFSDNSESWVSTIESISWPCDTLIMKNFKYEANLITNYSRDSVKSPASYLAIGCYISKEDAESAFKKYLNLPKAIFQDDENFCPFSLKGDYIKAAYLHKNYLILFNPKGFDLDKKKSMESFLENYFKNIK